MYDLLLFNFLVLMSCMVALWFLSILIGDVSFVDSFWALGFVVVALASRLFLPESDAPLSLLILVVTAVWGLRLAAYLFWRWRRDGADPRYVRMLEKAGGNPHAFSLRAVFLLQGVMLWTVSLPIQTGLLADAGAPPVALAYTGLGLATVGFLFESIGDWQMAAFRADPGNRSLVMDRGLWRYTRHPNYFGDACVFWGLWLLALDAGAPWWCVVGPLLLTWTLLRWSGAALLERRLKRSRPGYEDYIARTSSFIPWPPKDPVK
jgi:steroid 5-alpha reductase family enzyme